MHFRIRVNASRLLPDCRNQFWFVHVVLFRVIPGPDDILF